MEDGMVLKDELPRAQMPPNIRISHVAGSHGKETQATMARKRDGYEKGSHLRESMSGRNALTLQDLCVIPQSSLLDIANPAVQKAHFR